MKIKNAILTASGFIFLGLGAVGIVLPLVPTTPFVLLAAGCFSAGSKKFHDRLLRSRVFGQYIENYRTKQGIDLSLKIASIAFLWVGLIISMAVVRTVWICALLAIVGAGVTAHLLLIKTKKGSEEADREVL